MTNKKTYTIQIITDDIDELVANWVTLAVKDSNVAQKAFLQACEKMNINPNEYKWEWIN